MKYIWKRAISIVGTLGDDWRYCYKCGRMRPPGHSCKGDK